MKAARPEAESEYSRGETASREGFSPSARRSRATGGPVPGGLAWAILAGGALGALLVLTAEFTPLLSVHTSLSPTPIKTLQTGSHHAYALIPIALLAGALSYGVWRTGVRLALVGIALLGLVALLIALVHDLPDAQASGLIGNPGIRFETAAAHPQLGFYLETLGAVVLILTGGAGLLLDGGSSLARGDTKIPETRSAS